MKPSPQDSFSLPVHGNLRSVNAASTGIALLAAAASAAGLLFPSAVYAADEFRKAFIPNDVVSLVIGLPVLLAAMALAGRGKLLGILLWPGALLFFLYNYLIYVFSMPWNAAWLAYLALVLACGGTLILLVSAIDGKAVRDRLAGSVPERLCGGVLAVLGTLYFLLAASSIAKAVVTGPLLTDTVLAVNLADLAVSPAWIITGVLLWRRHPRGYALGLGLLFSLSMLFVGLIFIFILEPFLSAVPFRWMDTVVILIMGAVVFVPFVLFLRGVIGGRKGKAG
jgi:hypothetical protein